MKLFVQILLTFLIGFVAGVSPFLFMYLLPGLLNPTHSSSSPECDPWCVILAGSLIGAITSILFAKKFAEKDPGDIFFYALGIPAILIGALSNFGANSTIKDIQNKANSLFELKPSVEVSDKGLNVLSPPPQTESPKLSSLLAPQTAWAEEKTEDRTVIAAQTQVRRYFVVIGQYSSEKEAFDQYFKWVDKRLNTERYTPKNLKVFKMPGSGGYYLSYSDYASEADAIKTYKQLMLNDPGFSPKIIEQRQ